jgi:hypothetical protein
MSTKKEHKILQTGLHCIIDNKGRVEVYTEKEYTFKTWWKRMKSKYFGYDRR